MAYNVALKNSFFPRTIPLWNRLPLSVVARQWKNLRLFFKSQVKRYASAQLLVNSFNGPSQMLSPIILNSKFSHPTNTRGNDPAGDLIPKTRRCRNSHCKAFQLPSASMEAYKCSVFPRLTGTSMTSLTLCFVLLKCQMIVCPSSLHL